MEIGSLIESTNYSLLYDFFHILSAFSYVYRKKKLSLNAPFAKTGKMFEDLNKWAEKQVYLKKCKKVASEKLSFYDHLINGRYKFNFTGNKRFK